MDVLLIILIALYAIGFVATSLFAWKQQFSDHLGDPFLASMGLFLAILLGAIWPMLLAVSPLVLLMYGLGKVIVASGDRR